MLKPAPPAPGDLRGAMLAGQRALGNQGHPPTCWSPTTAINRPRHHRSSAGAPHRRRRRAAARRWKTSWAKQRPALPHGRQPRHHAGGARALERVAVGAADPPRRRAPRGPRPPATAGPAPGEPRAASAQPSPELLPRRPPRRALPRGRGSRKSVIVATWKKIASATRVLSTSIPRPPELNQTRDPDTRPFGGAEEGQLHRWSSRAIPSSVRELATISRGPARQESTRGEVVTVNLH